MVSWSRKPWTWLRAARFAFLPASLLLLISCYFTQLAPPNLLALKQAELEISEPRTGEQQAPSLEASKSLNLPPRPNASGRDQTIQLPLFKVRDAEPGLVKFVYSLTLDDKALGPLHNALNADATALENSYGVLFMQIINGGNFYLNGDWVAGLPESTATERRMWYQPFVVPLPSHLLRTDGQPNVLTASQTTHEPYILVAQPYFGTIDEVNRTYNVALFFGTTLAKAFNVLCLLAGLFLIGAWLASPKETVYALAGGASVMWAVLFTLALLNYTSVELQPLWRGALYVCEGGLVSLMSMFVLSFIGQPLGKWGRRSLLTLASVAPIVYAIGGRATEHYLDLLWTPALVMFYVYASFQLFNYCRKTRYIPAFLLLLQTLLCIALAFHDYAVMTGLIEKASRPAANLGWTSLLFEHIYLSHMGMPVMLIIMGYILLVQHKKNVADLENSSVYLEASLKQRELELEKSHKEHRVAARTEATLRERERIYQDIHDGIGSQLVKAIFSLRNTGAGSSAVEQNLQACLQDLRLIINASQEYTTDVQAAVFSFCVTQELHLAGSGLIINYDVGVEATVYAEPKVNLNVLRVLQESFSNTLKHSGATSIFVEVEINASDLILSITDDGRKHSVGEQRLQQLTYGESGNRGLTGLALRAAEIGGKYTINISSSGTEVRLSIPLPSPTAIKSIEVVDMGLHAPAHHITPV